MNKPLIKPSPDFPLTPHVRGYWVKYINGTQYRFGKRWCSAMDALKEYFATIDDIKQGIAPDRKQEGLKLRDACEAFLRSRRTRHEAGELSKRSLQDYETEVEWMIGILGPGVTVDSLRPANLDIRLVRPLAHAGIECLPDGDAQAQHANGKIARVIQFQRRAVLGVAFFARQKDRCKSIDHVILDARADDERISHDASSAIFPREAQAENAVHHL
ncbi:MAG: hypothetical protein MUD03_16225, partial [Pirellula sp.]|nr:hypothetical protein [Pirellula sp.]